MPKEESFTYVVVGAGSAGCVLAHRLSATAEASVLLVEAGGSHQDPRIEDPTAFVQLFGTDFDWHYETEPQAGLDGRRIVINRGKVLGGSSSINSHIYVRGNHRDFDGWEALGNQGWGYREVLPYFKRSEDFEGGASEFHGVGGPLSVTRKKSPAPTAVAFTHAAVELGFGGPDWDFNGPRQEGGAGLLQLTITRDGKRASSASAFLDPIAGRRNLTVRTGARTTRVLLDKHRATGIEYLHGGKTLRARAEREVIVCAGAFDSPKLLLLSGIGPAAHLKTLGIRLEVDLPGVGRNLADHLAVGIFFKIRQDPVLSPFAEAALFVRSKREAGDGLPDLQFHFLGGLPLGDPNQLYFLFGTLLAQPRSSGFVELRSADPLAPPVIQPNYLQDKADLQVLLHGFDLARRLAATKALSPFNGGEALPGAGKSQAEQAAFIRANASTIWHPVGTCRMGSGKDAVVDDRLRVRGVAGLRVADASIMPRIVSGNTNAACIMIGEKAADLVLGKSHGGGKGKPGNGKLQEG